MLMIDHVVLQSVDHTADVMDFEDEYGVRIEHLRDTAGNIVDVWNVRIDVVRRHQVGAAMRFPDSARSRAVEETIEYGNPLVINRLDYVRRRIHADSCAHTLIRERLQQ